MSRWIVASFILIAASFSIGYGVGTTQSPEPRPSRSFEGGDQVALDGVAADAREILLEPDTVERIARLSQLLRTLPAESLGDLLDAYETIFLDRGDIDLILLATWWARFDPAAAYEWTQREWQADHSLVVGAVIYTWALQDPLAALAAAEEVSNIQLRTGYVHMAIAGWDQSGQPGVVEYVRSLPEVSNRQRAITVLARRRVLRGGVEKAFEWVEDLEDTPDWFKLNAVQRVASAAAEIDPEAAGAFVGRHYQGPYGHGLIDRLARVWGRQDALGAMTWLATIEPGKPRLKGVRETYVYWLREDPAAAAAWLRQVERGPWLDPAVALYAKHIAGRAPLEGLDWAGGIADQELREATLARVARIWAVTDVDAAKAWVDQSNLPDWMRDKIFTGAAKAVERAAKEQAARETAAREVEQIP
jgi:hypothetical protein